MKNTCKEYGMKFGDLFVLLYASHCEIFTTNQVILDVPFGCETVSRGMRRLKSLGYINMIQGGGGKNKTKALYSISGKGKMITQQLYIRLSQGEAENLHY
mgnify:FL=1